VGLISLPGRRLYEAGVRSAKEKIRFELDMKKGSMREISEPQLRRQEFDVPEDTENISALLPR
jgi:hypothetical protein